MDLRGIDEGAVTEDDTFRMLARPGIHEMVDLYVKWERVHVVECSLERLAWSKHYGWQWGELVRAAKRAGYNYDD
jgi:hypothetical protein